MGVREQLAHRLHGLYCTPSECEYPAEVEYYTAMDLAEADAIIKLLVDAGTLEFPQLTSEEMVEGAAGQLHFNDEGPYRCAWDTCGQRHFYLYRARAVLTYAQERLAGD